MLAATVTPDPDKAARLADRRRGRFEARHTLWDESTLPRVRSCGRARQDKAAPITVKVSTGPGGRKAGYGGLQSCGSVWACPVCSAKIAAHRQGEIERALTAWVEQGGHKPLRFGPEDEQGDEQGPRGRVALASFTMRHKKGHRLTTLWDGQATAWHAVASGGGWADDQAAHGSDYLRLVTRGKRAGQFVLARRIPLIRVFETTHGDENGWHTHVHCLVLLPEGATHESVQALGASMFGRWRDSLKRQGFQAPSSRRGWDMELLTGDPSAGLADYFTKAVYSASMEAARGDMKDAKNGNRTPFRVLRDVVEQGVVDDLEIWHEWERGSKGRRQIAWSVGLRAELLPEEEELTEQDIVDLDEGGEAETTIDDDLWNVVQARRLDYAVLAAFQQSLRSGLDFLMTLSAAADDVGHAKAARLDEWGRSRSRVRQRV